MHHNLREIGVLMPHAHVGHRGRSVQDEEEDVLNIVHNNPQTSIFSDFFCNKTFSECSMVYSAWELVVPFPCSACTRVVARGQTSLSPIPVVGATQGCGHPSSYMPCVVRTDKAVFTDSDVQNLYNLHIWATENPQVTHHISLQQRFSVSVWARIRWLCNWTVCNARSWCSALHQFSWRNASTVIEGCASACMQEHAVSAQQYPSPFLHVECTVGLTTFGQREVWSPGLHILPVYMKEKFMPWKFRIMMI
jgi:hypothetical protein